MEPRAQITLRIEPADFRRLREITNEAGGLSVNQVGAALLHRALAEGWTVTPGTPPAATRGGSWFERDTGPAPQ
jgi:hypothetical protein